jgi:hypothetical protein
MITHHNGKGPTSTDDGVEVMVVRGRGRMRLRPPPAIAMAGAVGRGLRRAMQHFEFRVHDLWHAAPAVMHVLTRDEDSARTMAHRTLRETTGCRRIDVWAAGRHLFTVEALEPPASRSASRNSMVSPMPFWGAQLGIVRR